MELIQFFLDLQHTALTKWIYFSFTVFFAFVFRFFLLRLSKKAVNKRKLSSSELLPFLKSMINWGTFYAIFIFMLVYLPDEPWLKYSFKITGEDISILDILFGIIIITLGFRISQFVTRFLLHPTFEKYQLDTGTQYTFSRLSHYVIIVIASMIGLMNIGFNLTALTFLASIIGVGIGFGLQTIASNFISGIILLFERPFKIGDVVKMGDVLGEVVEVKIRATVIRTFDNEHYIIPNSHFIENEIINWSYGDERMRVTLPISVAYGTDVEKVKELSLKGAEEHPDILSNPEPRVDFLNFGDSSLDFRLVFWVASSQTLIKAQSDMNYYLNKSFKEHKIEIPYPQQDLHIRSVDPSLLNLLHPNNEDVSK